MRSIPSLSVASAALLAALGGCFYGEPINERPSADIERQGIEAVVRGGRITVAAQIYDPDGDATERVWSAYACDAAGCASQPLITGTTIVFIVDVPGHVDAARQRPTTRVRIELDVTDSLGARAVPRQTLDVDVGNAPPSLELQRQGHTYRGYYPVVMPMRIVGIKRDADDGPGGVILDDPATLFPGTGATLEGASITLIDQTETEATWEVIVDEPGQWDVRVTGADPVGARLESQISVGFALDQWPCMASSEPAFPPAGARVVLDARRRFAVLAVEDDLDLWPAPPLDPYLDAATFRWWLASPDTGGVLARLDGVDGAEVWLDPALYPPGALLELRVEIADRADRPLCDASMPSCEALADCAQRRTWAVEVR